MKYDCIIKNRTDRDRGTDLSGENIGIRAGKIAAITSGEQMTEDARRRSSMLPGNM